MCAMRAVGFLVLMGLAVVAGCGEPLSSTGAAPPSGAPPTASSSALGPVSGECGPAPSRLADPAIDGAVGAEPVWLWLPAILDPDRAMATATLATRNPRGWGVKAAWGVRAGTVGPVVVRGRNLESGKEIWFEPNAREPATQMQFEPGGAPNFDGKWAFFPGGATFPEAGCYEIEAQWPGGSWRIGLVFRGPP